MIIVRHVERPTLKFKGETVLPTGNTVDSTPMTKCTENTEFNENKEENTQKTALRKDLHKNVNGCMLKQNTNYIGSLSDS